MARKAEISRDFSAFFAPYFFRIAIDPFSSFLRHEGFELSKGLKYLQFYDIIGMKERRRCFERQNKILYILWFGRLWLHRPIAKKQIGVVGRGIPAQSAPVSAHAGRTRSDCRATPVSQNQVRQCEQHIQFGGLFSQTSVSRFSIPELPLNDRKYMFYLCPNR